MTTRIDPRGKYFTDIITKKQIRAVIQTVRECIEGTIYVFPDKRVLDEISHASGFIAVTDALITDGKNSRKVDFMAINIDHIVWMVEILDVKSLAGDHQENLVSVGIG